MAPQLAAGLAPLSGELDPQKEEVFFLYESRKIYSKLQEENNFL